MSCGLFYNDISKDESFVNILFTLGNAGCFRFAACRRKKSKSLLSLSQNYPRMCIFGGMRQTSFISLRTSWLLLLLLMGSLFSAVPMQAAARSAGNGPLLVKTQADPMSTARPRLSPDEKLDWLSFGLGAASILALLIGLLGGFALASLVAVSLGLISLVFSWWRRRFKDRKNWQTFVGRLGGSLTLLVLLATVLLIAFV
jgi:hypothetical protein